MNKTVLVFDGDMLTMQMFSKAGWKLHGPDTDLMPDLVVFTGGEDVTPSLYGEQNVDSDCNPQRDADEAEIFQHFIEVPKVGICRGGQFLNVMSGGRMWQDTDNHCRYHVLKDLLTGRNLFVSSTHHQMMRPSGLGQVIATARESTYRTSATSYQSVQGGAADYLPDMEVVYYPHTKALCFQPHPEYQDVGDTTDYFFELLERVFTFDEEGGSTDVVSSNSFDRLGIQEYGYEFDGAFGP